VTTFLLDVIVLGEPRSQGSLKHIGGGRLIDSSPHVRPQRRAIAAALRDALPPDWVALDAACGLWCEFVFARPAYHRTNGELKPSAPQHKTTPIDADKAIRLVGDAVTDAGVWVDDARCTTYFGRKRYATDDEQPHTRIRIAIIDE
jgi:crossover junction endodeoxyribonuclease RusA